MVSWRFCLTTKNPLWSYLSDEIEELLEFTDCDPGDINLHGYVNKDSFIRTALLTKREVRKIQKSFLNPFKPESVKDNCSNYETIKKQYLVPQIWTQLTYKNEAGQDGGPQRENDHLNKWTPNSIR